MKCYVTLQLETNTDNQDDISTSILNTLLENTSTVIRVLDVDVSKASSNYVLFTETEVLDIVKCLTLFDYAEPATSTTKKYIDRAKQVLHSKGFLNV